MMRVNLFIVLYFIFCELPSYSQNYSNTNICIDWSEERELCSVITKDHPVFKSLPLETTIVLRKGQDILSKYQFSASISGIFPVTFDKFIVNIGQSDVFLIKIENNKFEVIDEFDYSSTAYSTSGTDITKNFILKYNSLSIKYDNFVEGSYYLILENNSRVIKIDMESYFPPISEENVIYPPFNDIHLLGNYLVVLNPVRKNLYIYNNNLDLIDKKNLDFIENKIVLIKKVGEVLLKEYDKNDNEINSYYMDLKSRSITKI